jgi:hypothetical protein
VHSGVCVLCFAGKFNWVPFVLSGRLHSYIQIIPLN